MFPHLNQLIMPLKVTTWNIEHSSELLDQNPSPNITERIGRIRETIEEIDPDILLIVEGPKGEQKIIDFCNVVLNNQWVPVLLKQQGDAIGDRDDESMMEEVPNGCGLWSNLHSLENAVFRKRMYGMPLSAHQGGV
jgi:hypothetical protein